MTVAQIVAIAAVVAVIGIVVAVWLWFKRKQRVEAGVALGIAALVAAIIFPVFQKPIEDAWTPLLGQGTPVRQPGVVEATPRSETSNDSSSVILAGYGPERQLFTMEHPAPFVTINSITNSPNYGDERGFFSVKEYVENCTTNCPNWADSVDVKPGKQYQFLVFCENSVADSLDKDGSHVLRDLRVRVFVSQKLGKRDRPSGGQDTADAFLTASNASPPKIWSSVVLSSAGPVDFELIPGSGKILSNAYPKDGLPVADSFLLEGGMPLGYQKLDGTLRAGYQYALWFMFVVKAK